MIPKSAKSKVQKIQSKSSSTRSSLNQACLQHRSVGKRSSHRIRQARPIHVTGHALEIILKIVDHDGDHLYPVHCKVFKDELHHVKSVDVVVGIPLVVFDTTIIQLLRRYHYTRSRNCDCRKRGPHTKHTMCAPSPVAGARD